MRKRYRPSILTVILIFVILCAVDILGFLYLDAYERAPSIIRVLLIVTNVGIGLIIWGGIGCLIYLVATRSDRIKERISFSLGILNYGLSNNLEEKEIVKALCEGRGRKSKRIFDHVRDKLSEGSSLIEALSANERIFTKNIGFMLKAGERIGNLPQLISHCQQSVRLDRTIHTRVEMQFAYPVLVLILVLALSLYVFLNINPVFSEMIEESQGEITGQMTSPWKFYPVIMGMIAVWLIVRRYFFLSIDKKKNFLNYIRVLTSALDLNVEEGLALELSTQSCNNARIRTDGEKAEQLLRDGYKLDEAIAKSFTEGKEMAWFFRQSREADASRTFKLWEGILRDKMDRQADIFSQGLSTLLMLSVGVGIWIIATSFFSFPISMAYSLMW